MKDKEQGKGVVSGEGCVIVITGVGFTDMRFRNELREMSVIERTHRERISGQRRQNKISKSQTCLVY